MAQNTRFRRFGQLCGSSYFKVSYGLSSKLSSNSSHKSWGRDPGQIITWYQWCSSTTSTRWFVAKARQTKNSSSGRIWRRWRGTKTLPSRHLRSCYGTRVYREPNTSRNGSSVAQKRLWPRLVRCIDFARQVSGRWILLVRMDKAAAIKVARRTCCSRGLGWRGMGQVLWRRIGCQSLC